MHNLSVFIEEPNALDAFAYRGFLYVLTFDGQLLTYDVRQLTSNLQNEHGLAGLAVAYALFSSKGIGADAGTKNAWKSFDHFSSSLLRIRSSPTATSRISIEASAHLDMRIFYNQIFLATDVGTYRLRLDRTGLFPDDDLEPERMVTEPTESLNTGMGAIAASLGDEGLAVFLDINTKDTPPETRIESRSLRSSIGWGRTVNHPTHDSYELLESKTVKDSSGNTKLVSVSLAKEAPRPEGTRQDGAYAFWESGRMLVGTNSGVATLGRLTAHGRRREVVTSFDRTEPLSLGVTGNRCIVTESSEHIWAARGDQRVLIHTGEAASVRTFGGSQRYQRLIASTVEGGLLLTAVFLSDGEST